MCNDNEEQKSWQSRSSKHAMPLLAILYKMLEDVSRIYGGASKDVTEKDRNTYVPQYKILDRPIRKGVDAKEGQVQEWC